MARSSQSKKGASMPSAEPELRLMNTTLTSLKHLVGEIVDLLREGKPEEPGPEEPEPEEPEPEEPEPEEPEPEEPASHTVESARKCLNEIKRYPHSRRTELLEEVNSASGDRKRVWRRLLERCDALTARCTVSNEELEELLDDGMLDTYVAEQEMDGKKLTEDIDDKLGESRMAARREAE
jgi:hypothetical protein